ncbi:hypothetical protein Pcinc_042097 [Petrolisthes cinctipes]|uniref:Uncharacterized protein n=1 Tax=Petrolisthes cinctipes TaxID=88211 RepID=A0AAE1BIK7_PETCI|nr:hypothetical protein Pcinc_042097 [Petrolisthes cinctipes]
MSRLMWWVVWAVWAGVDGEVVLFPTRAGCEVSGGKRLESICNLTDTEDPHVVLEAPNDFNNYTSWKVIGALSLMFDFTCNQQTYTEMIIEDCKNVQLQRAESDQCRIRITLRNSEATEITFPNMMIKLLDYSRADKISLDTVNQFELEDSEVGEISITATQEKSTIVNSLVTDIKKMEFLLGVNFVVESSNISTIQGFDYNSSSIVSTMTNVIVDRVLPRGFIVSQGNIDMENVTFETLDSAAIVIRNGASVTIKNSYILNAIPDSWIIENGSTNFENVYVGSKSLTFKYNGNSLIPLALVVECPRSPLFLVTSLAAVVAFLAGIIIGCVTMYFFLYKKIGFFERKKSDKEGMELLSSSNEIPKQSSIPPQLPPPILTSKNALLPPKNGSLEEDEEIYDDLENEVDRPPVPPQPPKTPVPQLRNNVPQANNKDDNDDEEVYEDILPLDKIPPVPPPFFDDKPTVSAPALPLNSPPPIPQSSPAFSGFSSPSVGSPLPNIYPRTPQANPNDPSNFSTQSSTSSVPDERDKLPPPPPPIDDQDVYDDTDSILSSPPTLPAPLENHAFQNPPHLQPVPPGNKPSFLHNTHPVKPNPFSKPTNINKTLIGSVRGRWAPNKPQPPPPPPPPINDTDNEDIYEDI